MIAAPGSSLESHNLWSARHCSTVGACFTSCEPTVLTKTRTNPRSQNCSFPFPRCRRSSAHGSILLRLIPQPLSFTVGFVSATRFPLPKQSVYAPAARCQGYESTCTSRRLVLAGSRRDLEYESVSVRSPRTSRAKETAVRVEYYVAQGIGSITFVREVMKRCEPPISIGWN